MRETREWYFPRIRARLFCDCKFARFLLQSGMEKRRAQLKWSGADDERGSMHPSSSSSSCCWKSQKPWKASFYSRLTPCLRFNLRPLWERRSSRNFGTRLFLEVLVKEGGSFFLSFFFSWRRNREDGRKRSCCSFFLLLLLSSSPRFFAFSGSFSRFVLLMINARGRETVFILRRVCLNGPRDGRDGI